MTEIASLYATIGARSDSFTRAMNDVDDRLNNAGKSFNALGSVGHAAMVGVGAAVTGAAVAMAGFGAAVVSSTMAAADMEQQIADISAVMGLTADEADQVGTLINNLGLDPQLKVSATEAGAAIEMLARNGLELSEIMDGAARSTVLLGNATGGNFSMAADVATDAMAQFGMKAAEMQSAVNGIVGVTVASKFTLDDYRLAIAQAGGVASSVGVSFRDFNTVIAATAPSFASGSDAGTSFKTFLQRLIPQSKDAEAAMQQLGLITADGANQFFDAAGNMKDMADITQLLNEAFGGLTEEQKNAAAATIFGTDAMRTAFGLAGMTAKQFDALSASIESTDAAAAAATRMNTLSGAMEVFGGVVETVRIQIGQKFLPLATRLTRWATDITNKFAKPLVDWFGKVATSIENVTTRLTQAFDIGGLSGIIREVQSLGGEFASAFGGWATNMWQQTQANLSAWFGNLVSWVTDASKRAQLLGALTAGWTMFADWAGNLYGGVLDGVQSMFGQLYDWISDAGNRESILSALTDTWTMFADWAAILWDSVAPHLVDMAGNFIAWITDGSTWQTIGQALEDSWTFLADWAGNIWERVAPELQQFGADLAAWVSSGTAWQSAVATWTAFSSWAGGVWTTVQPKLVQFGADVYRWITDGSTWQKFGEGIAANWTAFSSWAASAWATVQPKLMQFGSEVWKWITDASTWQRFHAGVAERWTAFSAWAAGVWVTVQPKLQQFGVDLKKWIDDNAPSLSKWIDNFSAFGEGVLTAWELNLPVLEERMESFAASIEMSLERIRTAWAKTFGGGEGGGEGDLLEMLGWFFGALVGGLGNAILYSLELITEQVAAITESFLYAMQAVNLAMAGDWAGAQEMMANSSAAEAEGDLIQNAWEDLNNWWQDYQSGQQNPVPGGRGGGDTINVYVNGQTATGDVRAFAKLGVAEALRARGAQ